nr:upf0507 protein [Quercus suber]
MGITTMSDDQAALQALARQIRAGKSAVLQQQTMPHLSNPLPAPPSLVQQASDSGPPATSPMSSLMYSGSAGCGPALRGSQEQLNEAQAMSNSFARGSTSRPFKTGGHQSRLLPPTIMTDSPRDDMAQSYGLDAIANTPTEDAISRNVIPPHQRTVTKVSQTSGKEIETRQQKSEHVPQSPEVKQSPKSSFIKASLSRCDGLSATKPKNEILHTTCTVSPDSKSSKPSVDGISTWEVGPDVGSTTYQASVAAADRVSKSRGDSAEVKPCQPSFLSRHTASSNRENSMTVNAHSKDEASKQLVTDCPTFPAANPMALEAILYQVIASVNNLQERVDKLEEDRERRYFLGSKTRMEPFTVDIQCQNGFSGKVQTHSQMSGADLIRRIRCKAGVDQFETEKIVVRLGAVPLAHIAVIGEQGITADDKLTVACALPQQCSPINHHVLLVPTTDVLLNSKDRETNLSYAELAATEDFLASHVLRVPGGTPPTGTGAKEGSNVRENKSKAKQYPTINGRTVIVKDTFAYSNKGFKSLNQAQILSDAIYYPDVPDGQQWLVYYISRPLVGSYQAISISPAVISDEPSQERRKLLAEASDLGAQTGGRSTAAGGASIPQKKEIKNFGELLNKYVLISRQLTPGLEKATREFVAANETPIVKRSSRRSSVSSHSSVPSVSSSSIRSSLSGGSTAVHPTALELEPEEENLRISLESLVYTAIDLFQKVDKSHLTLLGQTTILTGLVVERMIERYVVEQVHRQTLFPRVCAVRESEDSDLESKIRRMADIDIAQVGIPIENGIRGKRELTCRLNKGVAVFEKMGVASSPQEMLDILLATQKAITEDDGAVDHWRGSDTEPSEKPSAVLTINADVLVSMLLVVVIRSSVRHLHSRLLYMRYFIFTDEVESGEQGYALATLEAVLSHLSNGSGELRKASKRNKLLWQAAKSGDVQALEVILQVESVCESDGAESPGLSFVSSRYEADGSYDLQDEIRVGQDSIEQIQPSNRTPAGGSLEHVFPFQRPPTPPPDPSETKSKKRVSLATLPRSQSMSSGYSSRSHSRNKSIDSSTSLSGDLSFEKLVQTQDADGNSVFMMAVESGQRAALKFLLSLPAHFRADFILNDMNDACTTLLSAAMQSGKRDVTDDLVDYLDENISRDQLERYLEVQDNKGRCAAHYLFHQPHLIQFFGNKIPWRLKDNNGQTPLFALCRSYDHDQYHSMVSAAIARATESQEDGQQLHLDDHIDSKGNTLLHIVNDPPLTIKLMRHCDSDVNAANDKRFTPLMVASKYGRLDLVRVLFGDPRVDVTLTDVRGLTAVELAKDDDVRNRIDDLVLLSHPTSQDGRCTTVVRSFFVEDATVRFVLKSGATNANGTITVTTCRRSVADFENLAKWLSIECPASWLPTHFNLPSPFLIPSKPSRAILRDTQRRLDSFLRSLLTHATFSTHELVWEFFLVPEIDTDMLFERSKRKAEARADNVKDDYDPVTDTPQVESFVAFARDQIKGVTLTTKKVLRAINKHRMQASDFAESATLASAEMTSVLFLPLSHTTAFDRYSKVLQPSESSPWTGIYYALHSMHSTSTALQVALNRPAYLIGSMNQAQRNLARSLESMSRSNRWTPNIGGLFEDAKKAVAREAWDKAAKARSELEVLGCELSYTQQTVASELASWQEEHVQSGRQMLRRFAKETIVKERARLEGMQRALRGAKRVS